MFTSYRRVLCLLLSLLMLASTLLACASIEEPPLTEPEEEQGSEATEPEPEVEPEPEKQPEEEEEVKDMRYEFKNKISEEVLCNYLARAVTISLEGQYIANATNGKHIKQFILNTGAKYICRAATCWTPYPGDYDTHKGQKAFIESVHKEDPYVVFEACVFECISTAVNQIPVPAAVFEAFDLPVENRNFSFDAMCFPDGSYKNQWRGDTKTAWSPAA